jgi:hypothetical protein
MALSNDADILVELQRSFHEAWCNRFTPLQWHTSLLTNKMLQNVGHRAISDHLSSIFLDKLLLGPLPSPFFS